MPTHTSRMPLVVLQEAVTGKLMDIRYLGMWIWVSNYLPRDFMHEEAAEEAGCTEEFFREALDHFKDIGCIQYEPGNPVPFLTDLPLALHALGITDAQEIRERVLQERREPTLEQLMLEAESSSRAKAPRRDEFLYVIGVPGSGIVKIGRTGDVEKRLRTLRNSSPNPIELLWCGRGSGDIEPALHERFRRYRTHGEWFDFGKSVPLKRVIATAVELGAVEVST